MKIYIQNVKVRTRILEQTLYLTRGYKFTRTFSNSKKEDIEAGEENIKKSNTWNMFSYSYLHSRLI